MCMMTLPLIIPEKYNMSIGHAGSTGISLAVVAAAAGCRCAVALPDDAAAEKAALLRALGARVLQQRPVSIAHPQHFVNVARRLAEDAAGGREPSDPEASAGDPSCADLGDLDKAKEAGGRAPRDSKTCSRGDPSCSNLCEAREAVGGGGAAGGRGESEGGSGRARVEKEPTNGVRLHGDGRSGCEGEGGVSITGAWEGAANGAGAEGGGAVFADQFENLANYRAHLVTGAEIWAQARFPQSALVTALSTGHSLCAVCLDSDELLLAAR